MAYVLIVEDDPDILSSLAEVIREEGFDVHTAANGYQALAQLEHGLPGVIFLDLMMPLMDGWRFIAAARERFPEITVPIVLLSAVHGLAEEARSLGVSHFLPKPFDLEDVAQLAHQYCNHRSNASDPH
jgi:CheY-like chemotaxis protein